MAGAAAPLTAATQRDKSLNWRTAPHLMELPATPSKSKLPGRPRFCSLTTLLVLFALVAGVAIFNQELSAGGGASRTETYYRKALVAKMYFGADGQTVTATSEEYSRSTVKEAAARTGAGAARAKAAAAAAAGEHGAGGAADEDDVDTLDIDVGAADAMDDSDLDDSDHDTSEPADADAGGQSQGQSQEKQQQGQVVTTVVTATIAAGAAAQQQPQEQQQQQEQKATEAKAAAEAAAAAAATQQQPQSSAQLSPQQQPAAQQQQAVDPADVSAWWSDVISPDGQRVPKPAKGERDISASLASAVTFDESAVADLQDCKISVLDVDKEWGDKWGAGKCDLADPRTWPFAAPGRGIDGHSALAPEQYQYSMEYWIAQSIRNSSRFTADYNNADFVFVDMHCYHSAWMAWLHPLNEEGRKLGPSPEFYIKRALTKLQGMRRFRETKGGSFGLVHPAPLMKGLLTEEAACEDLASVLNMVPERSLLCVWTQDSHAEGKSVLLPYAATSDLDMAAPVVPAADRETLIFFQGGCGHPDPAVRPSFTAGKMLRYWLVQELKELGQPDIHAECTCDICDGHMAHDRLTAAMSRSVFCPILPSNTQSSRRLTEAMLTGCIPVFVGEPFHTLPLAADVDYKSFALFVNVTDSSRWVNASSPKWEHNHMIAKAWKLDDHSLASSIVTVKRLSDLVRLLRSMPPDEVAARQAGVVANRLKFYYPAAPAEALAAAATAGGADALGGAPGVATATGGSLLGHGGRRRRRMLAEAGGQAAALGVQAAPQSALAQPASGAAATVQRQQQQHASVLGELLMRKMCHKAAAVKKRLEEAAAQGVDFEDSDEKVEHPALAGGAPAGEDGAKPARRQQL
ncbi:hypothetical protein ABPG77_005013 [Micractinium sp. CCAP 211/92]